MLAKLAGLSLNSIVIEKDPSVINLFMRIQKQGNRMKIKNSKRSQQKDQIAVKILGRIVIFILQILLGIVSNPKIGRGKKRTSRKEYPGHYRDGRTNKGTR